jgi:hypothetical protein
MLDVWLSLKQLVIVVLLRRNAESARIRRGCPRQWRLWSDPMFREGVVDTVAIGGVV